VAFFEEFAVLVELLLLVVQPAARAANDIPAAPFKTERRLSRADLAAKSAAALEAVGMLCPNDIVRPIPYYAATA
jgi:hypothetical protein